MFALVEINFCVFLLHISSCLGKSGYASSDNEAFTSEALSPKLNSCPTPGSNKTICQEKCYFEESKCIQKATVQRCSCLGYVGEITEVATYSMSGKLLSASLFGYTKACSPCYERCKKLKGEFKSRIRTADTHIRRVVDENAAPAQCDDPCHKHAGHHNRDKNKESRTCPPRVTGSCQDRGNLTRVCTEKCALDGLSCITEVEIDACTCGGRLLKLTETASYDMESKQRVFLDTTLEVNGYSRVCGNCIEFCEHMPGETKSYHVNERITTCYDSSKTE